MSFKVNENEFFFLITVVQYLFYMYFPNLKDDIRLKTLNKNIILINVTFQFLLIRDYCLEIMIELLLVILQTDFCGFQQYDEFSL